MIIISDLNYVEVISASSILGGATQTNSGQLTTTTKTNNSSFTKRTGFNVVVYNSKPTPLAKSITTLADDFKVEQAVAAL